MTNGRFTFHFNWLFLSSFIVILLNCNKTPAVEKDSQFIGTWRHYYTDSTYADFSIHSNSKGRIDRYEGNGMYSGTIRTKWLIKGNKLYLGYLASKHYIFTIDQYPTVSETSFTQHFDEVTIGAQYIILNGEIYVEQ